MIATLVGFGTAMAGLPVAFLGMGRGRRLPGERWLKLWKSRLGKWLFQLSGIRLGAAGSAPGYRPTEVLIGTAADQLYGGLSKIMRRELVGLPNVIARLEADADRMRRHGEALDKLIAQVDEDPGRVAADERARLRAELAQTRADAKARMGEALAALETIRLGLLRLHAGEDSLDRLTEALGSAGEVSAQIERLISGSREVAELLARGGKPAPE
jgi:hypothetical protein